MKNYFTNEGEAIDPPTPVGPCQSLAERMALTRPEPVVAGALSEEHRKILAEPETIDRREFDYMIASGLGMGAAFAACASGDSLDQEVADLCKAFGKQPVKENVRIERDKLDDGTYSVSEYDATTGRLLRGYISDDGEPPAAMR